MSTDLVVLPDRTRVMLALIAVHKRDGRATVRDVAEVADRSVYTTHRHLLALRRLGLAAWSDGTAGTLRPTVGPPRTHVRFRGRWSTTLGENEAGDRAASTATVPLAEHPVQEGTGRG